LFNSPGLRDSPIAHRTVIFVAEPLDRQQNRKPEDERKSLRKRLGVLAAVFAAIALMAGVATAGSDFGQFVQRQLADQSIKLYGFSGPLKA
jgi:hypothetical protein